MIAPAANAAGLGKLVVLSAMGEPFRAEVELLPDADDRASPTLRLASPDAYSRAYFPYNPALGAARLNTRTLAGGRRIIEILAVRPLNEPFVHLLLELQSGAARITRGYVVLLDPPGYTAPGSAASAAEFLPVIPAAVPALPRAVSSGAPAVQVKVAQQTADAREIRRLEAQLQADGEKLAAMLDRVAALEQLVLQMQRNLEPALRAKYSAAVERKPVTESSLARDPAAVKAVPVAVPMDSAPRHPQNQDSILNEALLLLAAGLLLLLAGLAWMVWGRPVWRARLPKGEEA